MGRRKSIPYRAPAPRRMSARRKQSLQRIRRIVMLNRVKVIGLVSVFFVAFVTLVTMAWASIAERSRLVTDRAAGVLELPDKPTRELIAIGDSLFHGPKAPGNCAGCHGDNGKGTRLGPPLNSASALKTEHDMRAIARVIRLGVYWPPSIGPSMPAFDGLLSREEIQAVAAYVYSISRSR
jgi:mono/diheme cytochrome c family protein